MRMQILIGAGGWSYFKLPKIMGDPLSWYAKAFNVVEVNSTFYEIPSIKLAESWRKRAPSNFEFTVKCHKSLTHDFKLELTNEAKKTLTQMIELCKTLKSKVLLIQTPSSVKPSRKNLEKALKIAEIASTENIEVAWEPRGEEWRSSEAKELMKEFVEKSNGAHCVDISKNEPAAVSHFIYTRLFGKGKHNIYQFSSNEIAEIYSKIIGLSEKAERAYVIAHTKKMYIDAARIKRYVETGKIPPATRNIGVEAVKEVLAEDAKFPITRDELIKVQGWKVITWINFKDIKLAKILEKIPNKKYWSIDEVCKEINKIAIKFKYI
ncbi:MAG: DUF72 domain-containing protein [archaeon GB-1867-005]|nr:DUF72 domain-containing protein [Candidatus Culexmicrobium cathedralense]